MKWPQHPVIAELDPWRWLAALTRRTGRAVTLGSVPPEEWDALGGLGLDAVWLAGVWERSPCARLVQADDLEFLDAARRVLPSLGAEDLAGSPLAVRRYAADPRLGGPRGLAEARRQLANRGLRLLLDFVPCWTALDHPWVFDHPSVYLAGTEEDLRRSPGLYFEAGGAVLAHARRPGGAVRRDAAQLDLFATELPALAAGALAQAAAQCDGLFCHGADEALGQRLAETWGRPAGPSPGREFWAEVVGPLRARHPDLLLVAATAEDQEWALLQLGFDLATDRRLRDRLLAADAPAVRAHLGSDPAFQGRLARFLGLGIDPPAAAALPSARHRAAAAALLTLPGARILGDGQREGRRAPIPPGLTSAPDEDADPQVASLYGHLLAATADRALRRGRWRLCAARGWPEDPSWENLLAWCWELGDERRLVVVNFSPAPAHGRVGLPWRDLPGRGWVLTDALSGETFERQGGELAAEGLYVGLPAWGAHLFRLV